MEKSIENNNGPTEARDVTGGDFSPSAGSTFDPAHKEAWMDGAHAGTQIAFDLFAKSLENLRDGLGLEKIQEACAQEDNRRELSNRLARIKAWADQALSAIHDPEIASAFEQISDEANVSNTGISKPDKL